MKKSASSFRFGIVRFVAAVTLSAVLVPEFTSASEPIVLTPAEHDGKDEVWVRRPYYGKQSWGIRASHRQEEGSVWFDAFPGKSGRYRVELGTILEQDGKPHYALRVGDRTIVEGQFPYLRGVRDCDAKGSPSTLPLGEHWIEAGSKISFWGRSVYECSERQGAYALWHEIRFTPLGIEHDETYKRSAKACGALIYTTPRGIACLHCMQPEARVQSELLTDIALDSCLKNIAINYLVDGSFGYDEPFLRSQIDKLTQGGRKLSLYLYLANGPWQRSSRKTKFVELWAHTGPGTFRKKILTDPAYQEKAREGARKIRPLVRYAREKGAEVYVTPVLEDNMTEESFLKLVELFRDGLQEPVRFGRNPSGHQTGNDRVVPPGMYAEVHNTTTDLVPIENGMISNDGEFYNFTDLEPLSGSSRLTRLRDNASAKRNAFILWTGKFQGMRRKLGYAAPKERNYALPSAAEGSAIIQFLRGSK